jgi:hypothetical protein
MSDQLTIRLPEDLNQALEAASVRLRRKRSDIVRLALYNFFSLTPANDDQPSARVQHLLGALDSGVPDLAENHRAYILESLKRVSYCSTLGLWFPFSIADRSIIDGSRSSSRAGMGRWSAPKQS